MNPDPTGEAVVGGASETEAQQAHDPFAVDLFAVKRAPTAAAAQAGRETNRLAQQTLPAVLWSARLPQVSPEEARLSSTLNALPHALGAQALDALALVIARYARVAKDDVELSAVEFREAQFSFAARRTGETAPQLFASLSVEPDLSRLALELDASTASRLVDLTLGGDGAQPDTLHTLSPTEQAVIEFLCLSLLREFNDEAGEPLLKLEGMSNNAPLWLEAASDEKSATVSEKANGEESNDFNSPYGMILTARLRVAKVHGLVRLYLTRAALNALSETQNPLLGALRERNMQERFARLAQVAPDVSLRLLIGETQVAASDLAELEQGDVLLVERSFMRWQEGKIKGRASLSFGDDTAARIVGLIETTHALKREASADENETNETNISLTIENFGGARLPPATERLSMENAADKTEGQSGESAFSLEDLLMTVHVQLAARRITLDELSRLRKGQILDLNCRATDPVDLIADGKRLARGELVDIEGRLGVRITQI